MSTLGGAQQVSIFFGPPLRCFFWGCHRQLFRQLSEPSGNLLPKAIPDEQKTAYKAAELFSTNRTNKRRNLTSSQWAAVAVEAEEIIAAIAEAVEQEQRKRQSENAANRYTERGHIASDNLLSEAKSEHETKTAHKAAELFNTNRSYINDAAKLKTERPDAFDNLLSEPKKEDTTARAAHKAPEPITQLIVEQPREKREAVEQERRSKIAESRQSETRQLIAQSKNHNDSKVG